MINDHFTPIDLSTWPRTQIFYYFSKMAPTGYSITVDVDITKMRSTLKNKGMKFFPAYLWLTTKILNMFPEFRTAVKDGQIGYYDTLIPLYATFHEDDKTFSLMWTEYAEDFPEFYDNYLENQRLMATIMVSCRSLAWFRLKMHTRFHVCRGYRFRILPFILTKTKIISFRLWKRENSMRMREKLKCHFR